MEHRIQQICQRRLRLSSELENVSTAYNNKISNRKMFIPSTSALQNISLDTLKSIGYSVIRSESKTLLKPFISDATPISATQAAMSYDSAHTITSAADLISKITGHESENFILTSDIDLSQMNFTDSVFTTAFSGQFDGNGHTLSNLTINSSSLGHIGLFSELNGGTIKNLGVENVNITSTSGQCTGGIAGYNVDGTVDNCYVTGTIQGNTGGTGGIIGWNFSNGTVKNSFTDVDISGNWGTGGIVGSSWSGSLVSNCYATGNVVNSTSDAGGVVGNNYQSNVSNCYSTGSVDSVGYTGGLVGYNKQGTVTYSYTTGNVNSGSQQGGLVGGNNGGVEDGTNFYKNNKSNDASGSSAVNANVSTQPTGSWDTNIWDLSGALPQMKNSEPTSEEIEEGLRNGTFSLVREADEFTQSPLDLGGNIYEEIDWRTVPQLFDELYGADDSDAESKYDKTIEEINSQDKKLQLEQTVIETEYKAITSEKESVKKVLDNNAQNSFKYFS